MTDFKAYHPLALRHARELLAWVREVLDQPAELRFDMEDLYEQVENLLVHYPPAEYLLGVSRSEDPAFDMARASQDNLLIFMMPIAVEVAQLRQGVTLRHLVRHFENIEAHVANLTVRLRYPED